MKKLIYAVKSGRRTGIFDEWPKCREQTDKYPNSKYRRFEYRSELEDEAEDVSGSLRCALKEAEEYLGDLEYLGESADYLEDESWKEDGFLFFGDESAAEDLELFVHGSEEQEEDIEETDGEYSKWLDSNRKISNPDLPIGYWKTAEDIERYIYTIRNPELDKKTKTEAAHELKGVLVQCLADVNLNNLTSVYRYKKAENILGYDTTAVSTFAGNMLIAYPKPKLSEIEKVENEVSMQQLLIQADAMESWLKSMVLGQDLAIEKLRAAYFDTELAGCLSPHRRGPRNVYLLVGPPGVGKTYMAQLFAKKLGLPFKRFDMSGYSNKEAIQELVGFAPTWMNSKPGDFIEFVAKKPKCVLLLDEIEKAHIDVIRLFLQILDDGFCENKHRQEDVSFKDAILFFTTNAARQLYMEAQNENLTALPEKVVIDALEKDKNPETGQPYFPIEILSRMSSNTVIMMNHLQADVILKLVEKDIDNLLKKMKKKYGYELDQGKEYVARTVLYSMGGSADARNASKMAGKLIDRELYEFLKLVEEKQGADESNTVSKIEWKCDLDDATEQIKDFYSGERDCVIPVFGTVKYKPTSRIKDNNVCVKHTVDIEEFMEMVHKENVLFAVIDYIHGLESVESDLNVADAKSIGREAFEKLRKEDKNVPVYVLNGSHGYDYTDKEKNTLMKKGVGGFIESKYFRSQLERTYMAVCCQGVMETLAVRHQVLAYETRKEFDENSNVGSIIFYNFRLETAVETEDKSLLLSDDLRPNKSWDDIYVSEDIKKELEFFIHYLQNPKKYAKKNVSPKGVLMYGPPGTGKTTLAKVVASESGVNFLSISADELLNGGSEKVHEEFRTARKYAPAIMFIDEIDAVGSDRAATKTINSALNALLSEMEGLKKMDDKPVFVMAATNLGERIDPALQRRFDRSFVMDILDKEGRMWILKRLIKLDEDMFNISDEKLENIVDRSAGLSPAILEKVVKTALREGIRSDRIIDDDLFDEMFEKSIMGEERVDSSQQDIERIAYHEAGHALIHLYYGRPPAYMSVVARGDHGGYVLSERGAGHSTKEYYLERICSALGGRAAEMVFKYGLTHSAMSDLKQATKIAAYMVCECGMYEKEIGLAVIDEEELKHNKEAKDLINQILSEQLEEAISIIEANKPAVKRLVKAVMKNGKKSLTEKEIQEVAGELKKK